MENPSALAAIIRYWKSVLALILVGTLVGLALGFSATKQYSSTAELFLSIQNADTTGEISQTSQYAQDQAANFANMATSERVLSPTITELGLDTTVSELARSVSADVPLNSSAITVSVTYPDAQQAADIANSAAKNLSKLVATLSPKVNNKTSPVVLTQVDTAVPAEAPASPSLPLYAISGLVLGGLGGTAIALVRAIAAARRAPVGAAIPAGPVAGGRHSDTGGERA